MCRTAKEIQKLWEPVFGDIYFSNNKIRKYQGLINISSIYIWLPQRGQLQILANKIVPVYFLNMTTGLEDTL